MNNIYSRLKLSEIKVQGLLKAQLEAQLAGLSGNISKIWQDLSDNNAWRGGSGEAWERGPYYLSGLIPLAYLLDNDWAKAEVQKWVNAIVASQRQDGNFGPERNRDWWPRMVVLKALVPYTRATGDKRILPFMKKYFTYQYNNIDNEPLKFWASARGLEAMEAIRYVYQHTQSSYLIKLVEKLKSYTYDYTTLFSNFPYTMPMTKHFNKFIFNLGRKLLAPLDKIAKKSLKIPKAQSAKAILNFNNNPLVKKIMLTHGVNLAHAIKYPVTYGAFINNKEHFSLAKKALDTLCTFHGNATGLYSCDEHLMGPSPAQGLELCTVVEAMYSLQEIGLFVCDSWVYQLLEYLAYNTLPATFSPDMCAHQYVQQPNQIAADAKRRQFFDTDKYANTFGLEPNFGCCTANMHSGFPKFAEYLALAHPKGLAFMVYGEAEFYTNFNGGELLIKEITNYPFGEDITFEVTKATGEVELHFRKIENTEFTLLHNNKQVADAPFPRVMAKQGDSIKIKAQPKLSVMHNADNSISIKYGNLLLATKLSAKERYLKGPRPFHDRTYNTTDEWRIAPLLKDGAVTLLDYKENVPSTLPFELPPFEITIKGALIENWELKHNSVNIPKEPFALKEAPLVLVPYGCTRLRIAQYPKIETKAITA